MVALIKCAWCGDPAKGYGIEVPNDDVEFCDHCGSRIGTLTRMFSFCSSDCMKKFLDEYVQSSNRRAKT